MWPSLRETEAALDRVAAVAVHVEDARHRVGGRPPAGDAELVGRPAVGHPLPADVLPPPARLPALVLEVEQERLALLWRTLAGCPQAAQRPGFPTHVGHPAEVDPGQVVLHRAGPRVAD